MRFFIWCLPLLLIQGCFPQVSEVVNKEIVDRSVDDDKILIDPFFLSASFPGGFEPMKRFIRENLRYQSGCTEGRVFVRFSVNVDGTLSDVEVLKGLCIECDKSALDVMRKMPPWTPASVDDVPVKCSLVIPIKFSLD